MLKNSFSNTYLGYIGAPYHSNDFFQLEPMSNFIFKSYFKAYLASPDEINYYNTRKPFTKVDYSTNTVKLMDNENLHIIHTQNVNRDLNVGLDYSVFSNYGQYSDQKIVNQSLTAFSSYKRKRYGYYFNINYNIINRQENGGIVDSSLKHIVTNNLDATVNLESATSKYKNMNVYLNQSIFFDRLLSFADTSNENERNNSISYIVYFERNKRQYEDNDTVFYNKNKSLGNYVDSSFSWSLNNEVQVNFGKVFNVFRWGVSLLNVQNILKYQYSRDSMNVFLRNTYVISGNSLVQTPILNDSLYSWKSKFSYPDHYFKFYLTALPDHKLYWTFKGQYGISGYNHGDISLKLNLKQALDKNNIIFLNASYELTRPSYMLQNFESNRYRWTNNTNDFNQTKYLPTFNQTGYTHASIGYTSVSDKINISINYGIINNIICIDSISPYQYNKPVNVGSLSINKLFVLGKFCSYFKIVYQITSNDTIVRLPKLSGYNSTYFDHTFNFRNTGGQLHVQLGADFYWNSAFFMDGYNPETGLFYHQNEKKSGNYPYVNVFGKFGLKRFLFFIMYEHVNSGFSGLNYFNAYHYPMDTKSLKIGLTWLFYD